jgi:DHA1 family multidrug resistance protein-like MFS transporter
MAALDRATLYVYLTFSLQAAAQAISWQFVTYFVKHELHTPGFLELTIIWSAPAIVTLLMANFWGWMSDRLGKRTLFMIVGFLGYAVTFLLYSFVADSLQYLVVALAGATFSSAALPAGQALLTTQTDRKGERLGTFVAAQSGGWFLGAFLSGALYDYIGMFALYRIAAALSFAATIACSALIRDIPLVRQKSFEKTSLSDILRRAGMARLTLAVALSQIGINSVSFLLAIMIVDELGGTTAWVGLANSGATLIAFFLTRYVGRVVDNRGPVRVLVVAYVSYVVFAALFAVVTNPIVAVILWALPIYPLSSTATAALAALISGEGERGRAMSLVYGAQNAGSALGPILGGVFAEFVFLRVQPISWINMLCNLAALLLAASLFNLHVVQRVDRQEHESTPSAVREEPIS